MIYQGSKTVCFWSTLSTLHFFHFPGITNVILIVLIRLIFCYIVLVRVDVSVPSGAFLSLAGTLLV